MAGNKYLIETALLTHGLRSISDAQLMELWGETPGRFAWMENGVAKTGTLGEYLPLRKRAAELVRIHWPQLEQAQREGWTGALTASGTMGICAAQGAAAAVTCGMGGIGDLRGEELCPDLPALRDLPVVLIATSPKDMLDIPATLAWLKEQGVCVRGWNTDRCTGFLFSHKPVWLDGTVDGALRPPMLILNGIAQADRLEDSGILDAAVAAGKAAEAKGEYYHPAANGRIDQLSRGRSSRMQVCSLKANAQLAARLFGLTD